MTKRTIVATMGALALLISNAQGQIANISTRGHIGDGEEVLIAGFILNAPATVVIRALGPTLQSFGVANALWDPTLMVAWHDDTDGGTAYLIASNDDWDWPSVPDLRGLAPRYPTESAVILTLPAGRYTAIVAGLVGTTGMGLVEVYLVQ